MANSNGNPFDVFNGAQVYDLSSWFDTAANKNSDNSFTVDKTSAMVELNAADAQVAPVADPRVGLSDFWQGIAKTIVGYGIAKDAAQSGITTSGGQAAQNPNVSPSAAPATSQVRGFSPLMVGALLLGVWFVAKKG